tara:strand:+ start:363 stop:518 length:156 start_codon:yes stop_codon:yes gene_type:complete
MPSVMQCGAFSVQKNRSQTFCIFHFGQFIFVLFELYKTFEKQKIKNLMQQT